MSYAHNARVLGPHCHVEGTKLLQNLGRAKSPQKTTADGGAPSPKRDPALPKAARVGLSRRDPLPAPRCVSRAGSAPRGCVSPLQKGSSVLCVCFQALISGLKIKTHQRVCRECPVVPTHPLPAWEHWPCPSQRTCVPVPFPWAQGVAPGEHRSPPRSNNAPT